MLSLGMLMTWIYILLVYQKYICLALLSDQPLAVSLERTSRDLCMGTDSGLKPQTLNLVLLKASHFNTTKCAIFCAHICGMYETTCYKNYILQQWIWLVLMVKRIYFFFQINSDQ